MKINEYTKFAITLMILPWIPAFILYRHSMLKLGLIIIGIFLILSFICFVSKKFAKIFKDILTKAGNFFGKYIAIIILFIGYIFVVIPTGLLMKLVKRDRLILTKPEVNSYWKKNENNETNYEYQF